MALLQNPGPAPTPAQAAAAMVKQTIQAAFDRLRSAGVSGWSAIWQNPDATPAEVIAALGTDAAAIFQLANLNAQTIASASSIGEIAPPNVPTIPEGYAIGFNQDGSGTLTGSPAQ